MSSASRCAIPENIVESALAGCSPYSDDWYSPRPNVSPKPTSHAASMICAHSLSYVATSCRGATSSSPGSSARTHPRTVSTAVRHSIEGD